MTILKTAELTRIQPGSLSFLYLLLPLMLLAFYLAPKRLRPGVLLIASLGYCYLAQRESFLLLPASAAAAYLAQRLMERYDKFPRYRKRCFTAALCFQLALLLYCASSSQWGGTPLALGAQIYALSSISALWDVYRREIACERRLIPFALYIAFFPRLYAGPLQSLGEFAGQLDGITMRPGAIVTGWGQYIQGVFKAAVFGGQLYALHLAAGGLEAVTALSSWLRVFTLTFALYFSLSGYSDIAQGIGTMFGLRLPRNFYYPFQSRDMGDFFNRFLITINKFLKDTVYAALRGDSPSAAVDSLSLLVTGMLLGLWFGPRFNYLLWGAFLALFVILERYAYPKLLEGAPLLFRRLGTLGVVLASFTIFSTGSLGQSAGLVRSMLDLRALYDEPALYLLSSNWLLLLCSCFFASNIANLAATKLRRAAPVVAGAVFGACDLAILIVYTALRL